MSYVEVVEDNAESRPGSDYVTVSGIIRNTHLDRALCYVELRIRLADSRGINLHTADTYMDSVVLYPNATSTFERTIKKPPDTEKYGVKVIDATFTSDNRSCID